MSTDTTARHITECATIQAPIPARMRKLTAHQITDAVFAAETADGKKPGKTAGMKMLEETASAVFSPEHWKNPIYAKFTRDADGRDAREWVKAAIIWYHGAEPIESGIGVYSQGYACD